MRSNLSKKLRQLDEFLLSDAVTDDCMMLSELDGFLTGIVICPDLIMPSEWMEVVWGSEPPVFDDMEQLETVNGSIMWMYNDIIRQLDQGRYAPLFDVDTRTGETMWEMWIEGFHKALTLRPDACLTYRDGSDAHKAFSTFMRLHDICGKDSRYEPPRSGTVIWR